MRAALVFLLSLVLLSCAPQQRIYPLEAYEEVDAATIVDAPTATPGRCAPDNRDTVVRGEYLVELLGCGACHTDGALIGEPDMSRALAGSRIGIAASNPLGDERPGITFPPNITPHIDTGIGSWSDPQIAAAIRSGIGRHGDRRIEVMPWPGYSNITREDVDAIVAYLRCIDPVEHRVPLDVEPGSKTSEQFVYFGVYRSR